MAQYVNLCNDIQSLMKSIDNTHAASICSGHWIIYVVKQVDLSLIPPQTTSQFSHDLVNT